jgi:tetratricopeptide (TPR) repeat protein
LFHGMKPRSRILNKQQIQERIEKCQEILGANPESQIFAALAEAYRKLGDLTSALNVCNEGIAIHPDYGSAHLVLAKVARDQRRFKDAERAAFKSIELDGRTRSAEILLSDVYLQTGKYDKAEDLLNDLEKADPNNHSVSKLRELARKAKRLSEMSGSGDVLVAGSATGALLTAAPGPQPVSLAHLSAPAARPVSNTALSAIRPGVDSHESAIEDPPRASTIELTWESIFANLERYPHLKGKLATAYDGILLDSDLETKSEAESVAAMAADLFSGIRGDWPGADFGVIEQMFIETQQSSWLIWPFEDFILLLWCDPEINMGPLRMRLQHIDSYRPAQSYGGVV